MLESLRGASTRGFRPLKDTLDGAQQNDDSLLPRAAPGLQNETGEYNCFLNVIIQCLWHCRDFRERLMALPAEMVGGAAILSEPL